MKKNISILIIASVIIFTPFVGVRVVSAWSIGEPIVPSKCGTLTQVVDSNGKPKIDPKTKQPVLEKEIKVPCDFEYLMQLVNNLISFLLFAVASPLAALALCYAGALMIFSGGSSEKVTKAKHIIRNVIIGYIIALAAWLIIFTILKTLGFDPKEAHLDETAVVNPK